MVEPGGLPSMGSHRVRHDCSDLAAAAANVISIKTSQSTAIGCLVCAKDGGVCIRRCVLPFQLVGGTSHIHVRKIGNLQGAGLWRMAEDRKQRHA